MSEEKMLGGGLIIAMMISLLSTMGASCLMVDNVEVLGQCGKDLDTRVAKVTLNNGQSRYEIQKLMWSQSEGVSWRTMYSYGGNKDAAIKRCNGVVK